MRSKDADLLEKLEFIDSKKVEDMIDRYTIGLHAERNRKLLKRRLIDGVLYDDLAEEFNLSTRQVQNIMYKNIQHLLKVLEHVLKES